MENIINIPIDKSDLYKTEGKLVQISASARMCSRHKFSMNGMWFRVIKLIKNTDELFLEPTISEFKDTHLQLLALGFYGIEWDIIDVADNKED